MTANLKTCMNVSSKLTIPTYITICRFFLVPIFIYFFMVNQYKWAVIVLIAASLSDLIDGYLARTYNMKSTVGAMLDPLADKFLMLLSFVALSIKTNIPIFVTVLVISRDLYIILGVIYLSYIKKIQLIFKPTKISKFTTFSQLMLLILSFLQAFLTPKNNNNPIMIRTLNIAQLFFVYAAFFMTLITFFQYTKIGLYFLHHGEKKTLKTS